MANKTINTIIRERVSRGVKLLNRVKPGWFRKVRPRKLNMADCWECILGQLFGEYTTGQSELFKWWDTVKSIKHGFSDHTQVYGPKDLKEAWLEVITTLRRRDAKRKAAQ